MTAAGLPIGDVAVWTATALSLVSLLPQLWRLWRGRDVAGVSVSAPVLGVVTNAGWTLYLLAEGLWAAVPSAGVMAVLYGVFLALLQRAGAGVARALGVGVAWAGVLTAIAVSAGWPTFGLVLGLAYGVQVAPVVWAAYRTWAPTGVSPWTWTLVGVEVALWGIYGAAERDLPLLVFAGTGCVASVAMLARCLVTRGRSPHRSPRISSQPTVSV